MEFDYFLFKNYGSVGLYIDFGKGYRELNEKVFNFLYKHKNEFERALGSDLEWRKYDRYRGCAIYKKSMKEEYLKLNNGTDYKIKWSTICLNYI